MSHWYEHWQWQWQWNILYYSFFNLTSDTIKFSPIATWHNLLATRHWWEKIQGRMHNRDKIGFYDGHFLHVSQPQWFPGTAMHGVIIYPYSRYLLLAPKSSCWVWENRSALQHLYLIRSLLKHRDIFIMTSLNRIIFTLLARCGGIGGFPSQSLELWCFLWSVPEQKVKKIIETLAVCDAIALTMASL